MTDDRPTTQLITRERPLFDEARLAIASFLARYSGATRVTTPRISGNWFAWCHEHHLAVFGARRGHLELWARMQEDAGLARSTVSRRLSTVAGFYRFAAIDGIIEHSPAEYVRRPKIDTESATLGLDRMELSAFIAQGAAAGPVDHALACLLGLLGLRDRHRGPVGGPRPPHRHGARQGRQARPHPHAAPGGAGGRPGRGGTHGGPLLLTRHGNRMNRHAATRIVRRLARRAGLTKHISPHSLRHSFITAALDAGVPLRDVQIAARHADPRTTTRYDRARNNLDRHASYIVAAFIAGGA